MEFDVNRAIRFIQNRLDECDGDSGDRVSFSEVLELLYELDSTIVN